MILTLKAQAASPRSQFFASLEKWIGARNPVRIGSSCAAVTGYNFPLGQSFGPEHRPLGLCAQQVCNLLNSQRTTCPLGAQAKCLCSGSCR
jgi:hypothetical protein